MNEITRILANSDRGARKTEELLTLVYDELRKLAQSKMAHELPGQTLQATALVHEAYLRLAGQNASWSNRAHFFAAAAEAMRRILIDRARHRRSLRHGGGKPHVPLDGIEIAAPSDDQELLMVDEALETLTAVDPEKAELVKLKYFVGLSTEEAAALLGLSEATAKRHWAYARAWLFRAIKRAQQ